MNTGLRLSALAICSASLVSCAGLHTSEAPARPVSQYYAVAPGNTAGVVAFVYGKHTVLEFKSVPAFLSIRDGQGANVDYEREGNYARLSRRLQTFTASMNGRTVTFTALQSQQVAAPAAAAAPVQPVRLAGAELSAVLNKMQQQISEIRKSLAWSTRSPASARELRRLNARLDLIEAQVKASEAIVLQVSFPTRGTEFKPSDDIARALIQAANAAALVNLRGHTDAKIAGLDDASIALGRALSARKYLVDRGVTPEKIHVYSKPDGDFIAPHWTKEGRAKNRRVEIELVTSPLVVASKEGRMSNGESNM